MTLGLGSLWKAHHYKHNFDGGAASLQTKPASAFYIPHWMHCCSTFCWRCDRQVCCLSATRQVTDYCCSNTYPKHDPSMEVTTSNLIQLMIQVDYRTTWLYCNELLVGAYYQRRKCRRRQGPPRHNHYHQSNPRDVPNTSFHRIATLVSPWDCWKEHVRNRWTTVRSGSGGSGGSGASATATSPEDLSRSIHIVFWDYPGIKSSRIASK